MVIAMSAADSSGSWIGTVIGRPTQRAVPLHWLAGLVLLVAVALVNVGSLVRLALGSGDSAFHDTYYVVSHFSLHANLIVLFAFFAVWYYLFPKVTGRRYSEVLGRLHFWLTALGVGLVLVVLGWVLYAPRRFADRPEDFAFWNWLSSAGSYLAAAGTLVFVAAMIHAFLVTRGRHG
jgi:cytochrome c oxidase subunit I